jgi:hypothetical protein
MQRIDDICLDFCTALLDRQLKGDIFESVLLDYMAVIGIDVGNSTFYEAMNYTSMLSGLYQNKPNARTPESCPAGSDWLSGIRFRPSRRDERAICDC